MASDVNKLKFPSFPTAAFPPQDDTQAQPCMSEVDRLTAALNKSEAEREREKLMFSDAMLRMEQAAFEVEERARERAAKIIKAAGAAAEKTKANAERDIEKVRTHLKEELAAVKKTLTMLTESSSASRQALLEQFKAFDKSLVNIADILSFAEASADSDTSEAGNEEFLEKMSSLFSESPFLESDSLYDTRDPHRPIGD